MLEVPKITVFLGFFLDYAPTGLWPNDENGNCLSFQGIRVSANTKLMTKLKEKMLQNVSLSKSPRCWKSMVITIDVHYRPGGFLMQNIAQFVDFSCEYFQVSSVDVRFPIRLEPLALEHRQFCSYEPELFPGLVYRMYTHV